jgi:hypothetical protein
MTKIGIWDKFAADRPEKPAKVRSTGKKKTEKAPAKAPAKAS